MGLSQEPPTAHGTPAGRTSYRCKESISQPMTATTGPQVGQIHALLAERGYEVSETAPDTLKIRETESGISIQAVLQGQILFLSLVCTVVPRSAITKEVMTQMLAADNGISTSAFQLYDIEGGKTAVTLNNFCKIQSMGADDQDDILSCVNFLMVDVMSARRLVGHLQ